MNFKDFGIDVTDVEGCRERLPELLTFADERHPSWLIEYAAEGVKAQLDEVERDAMRHAHFGRAEHAQRARDRIERLTRLLQILGCLLAATRDQLIKSQVDKMAEAMGWGRKQGGKGGGKGTDTGAIK